MTCSTLKETKNVCLLYKVQSKGHGNIHIRDKKHDLRNRREGKQDNSKMTSLYIKYNWKYIRGSIVNVKRYN